MHEAPPADERQQAFDCYEIRVQGHLDELWTDRFADLVLQHEADGTTTLTGPVVDQAALHGLLRTVRDLSMTLLSVTRIDAVRCQQQ